MSRSGKLPLLLLPLLLLLLAFRQAPLVDPAPIAVPAKLDVAQVEKAVKLALVKRQWVINSDDPGKITATYARREFSVQIGISYDNKQVQIRYITSTGLKYEAKDGQKYIHKNYIAWTQNLVSDISGNMTLATL
jgi:hypothetical protein